MQHSAAIRLQDARRRLELARDRKYAKMVPFHGVDLICDEEGKLKGLPPNRKIFRGADLVCGDFFLVRHDEAGESVSLTDADVVKFLSHEFWEKEA